MLALLSEDSSAVKLLAQQWNLIYWIPDEALLTPLEGTVYFQ